MIGEVLRAQVEEKRELFGKDGIQDENKGVEEKTRCCALDWYAGSDIAMYRRDADGGGKYFGNDYPRCSSLC